MPNNASEKCMGSAYRIKTQWFAVHSPNSCHSLPSFEISTGDVFHTPDESVESGELIIEEYSPFKSKSTVLEDVLVVSSTPSKRKRDKSSNDMFPSTSTATEVSPCKKLKQRCSDAWKRTWSVLN